MSLSQVQKQNLERLSDYLLNLPDDYDGFDMAHYAHGGWKINIGHSKYDAIRYIPSELDDLLKEEHCNTVCCAVGHGPASGISGKGYSSWTDYVEHEFGMSATLGYIPRQRPGECAYLWCFSDRWKEYDNTSSGAGKRIQYMLKNPGMFNGTEKYSFYDILDLARKAGLLKMGLDVTFYLLPNGRQVVKEIENIRAKDIEFFKNTYDVSMEELATGQKVVYSTTGKISDEGELSEVIYLVPEGESCEVSMSKVRELVIKTNRGI